MPILSQNEFLLPFLNLLRDGQPHTRAEILDALAKRFNLTEEELNDMSGHQLTITNRIAWCDAYFGKAGFIAKEKNRDDNMQDIFRITIVGQNQLHHHAQRITVGYLQTFYKGKVYRGSSSSDADSDAELELFERFTKLPEPFTVFHSVSWIGDGLRTVGEIDFLVAHPDYGVLVIEAKGGIVTVERSGNTNEWYSRDRFGKVHDLKDPCSQAERSRRQLREYLKKNRITQRFKYALFPAVALPESQVDDDIRMDCRSDIFIDHRHLDNLEVRMIEIFRYWQLHADGENQHMHGQPAIDAMIEVLIPQRKLHPRIGDMFERERQKIEQLTEEQFQLLRFIQTHKRAAIIGGAGTGKSMLAIEKAQQLVDDGLRVLFLAFNRNIVQWVGDTLDSNYVTVTTYHAFVGKILHQVELHPGKVDNFFELAPELLMQATEYLHEHNTDLLYDAVIVDEAQDFDDEMWVPIPELLKDPQNGILYVFFDDNQRLYTQMSNVPIDTPPFPLTRNCRNTQRIHATLMPYAMSDTQTTCNGPDGRDVEIIPFEDETELNKLLQRSLHRLVVDNNISCSDIVILTPQSQQRSIWNSGDTLGQFVLTWDMDNEAKNAIKVSSIYAYKGLESAVVILTELDKLHDNVGRQLVYVGLSRARNHAIILGSLPEPEQLSME